jgi:hypothetical protein
MEDQAAVLRTTLQSVMPILMEGGCMEWINILPMFIRVASVQITIDYITGLF